ncbi:MAG: hypothetical protein JXR48_02525 [Candidatus Delongbacteria bacterium]|nr:hypothetical protein [Candidatus Delongbacteria bacterium]
MNKILIILLYVVSAFCNEMNNNKLLDEYRNDSLSIEYMLWRVKSEDVRNKVVEILDYINNQKQIYSPYEMDFYYSKDYYGKNYEKILKLDIPIDAMLDSLESIINYSKILRIVKSRISLDGSEKAIVLEDKFIDMDKNNEMWNLDLLRNNLIESVTNKQIKTTFEWIWGRTSGKDVYFSTKLTSFSNHFSVYPVYRTYLGEDSFRQEPFWFSSLMEIESDIMKTLNDKIKNDIESKNITEKKETDDIGSNVTIVFQNSDEKAKINQNFEIEKDDLIQEKANSDIGKSDNQQNFISEATNEITTIEKSITLTSEQTTESKLSCTFYKRDENDLFGSFMSFEGEVSDIFTKLLTYSNEPVLIRLSGADADNYFGINTNGNELYAGFGSTGLSGVVKKSIERMISDALLNPLTRKSIELITSKSKKQKKYYFTMITVYDNNISVFYDYDRRIDRKTAESLWFLNLPEKQNN